MNMTCKLKDLRELKIERPPRLKLSVKESLKRTQEFEKRKEQFIATVRKGKNLNLPA
jgi:hypothetical protein